MPLTIAREDRRLFLIGGGILLVLVALAALLTPAQESGPEIPSTYSTASSGAKAAYLLLKENGYTVERWEQAPQELPAGKGCTLILADPVTLPNADERAAVWHFIATGGRVIATGVFAATFLPENHVQPEILGGDTWRSYVPLVPSPLGRVAPQITMAREGNWKTQPYDVALYGDADGSHDVVIRYAHGQGEVIWWAGSTPLTNAGLKERGNLEFVLASLGDRQDTRIMWDEYYHGHRRSLVASIAHTQVRWLFVQLGLVAVFVLLTHSRRSGPVRPAVEVSRLSPLEFVDTLGGLYQRADAAAVAVEVYYQRFRYWLTRRLGVASDTSIDDLERYVRERWRLSDSAAFAALLRRCDSARHEHDLPAQEALQLVQQLHDFAARLELFHAPVPRGQEKP